MPSAFGLSGRRGWAAPNRRSRRKSAWLAVPFSSACGVTTLRGWRVSRIVSAEAGSRLFRPRKKRFSDSESKRSRNAAMRCVRGEESIVSVFWKRNSVSRSRCRRCLGCCIGWVTSGRVTSGWFRDPSTRSLPPKLRPLSKTSSRTDCRDRSPASGQEDRRLLPRRMPLRTTRDADSQMSQAWFTTHRGSANGVQRPLGDCRRESPDRSSRSDSLTGVEFRDH